MQMRLYLWATGGNEPGHCATIPEQRHHSTCRSPRGQARPTREGGTSGDWGLEIMCLDSMLDTTTILQLPTWYYYNLEVQHM